MVPALFPGADVLVHEATFTEEEAERARETMHSTAAGAARIAAAAGVSLLALTHLSARYAGAELLDEALAIFAASVAPRDFDRIDVPLHERGEPTLVKGGARSDHERTIGVR
jgi:ribonuclease Z